MHSRSFENQWGVVMYKLLYACTSGAFWNAASGGWRNRHLAVAATKSMAEMRQSTAKTQPYTPIRLLETRRDPMGRPHVRIVRTAWSVLGFSVPYYSRDCTAAVTDLGGGLVA